MWLSQTAAGRLTCASTLCTTFLASTDSFWFDNAWYGCTAGGLAACGGVSSVSNVDELQLEDAIFVWWWGKRAMESKITTKSERAWNEIFTTPQHLYWLTKNESTKKIRVVNGKILVTHKTIEMFSQCFSMMTQGRMEWLCYILSAILIIWQCVVTPIFNHQIASFHFIHKSKRKRLIKCYFDTWCDVSTGYFSFFSFNFNGSSCSEM